MNKEKIIKEIFKEVTEKGWNFYLKPLKEKIDREKVIEKGPAKFLKRNVMHIILPKVGSGTEVEDIDTFIQQHQVGPMIEVPAGFRYVGRVIYQFHGGDEMEDCLMPGSRVNFIGIRLEDKEIKLLASTKTFMPYNVFLAALKTLRDISSLKIVDVW